MFWLLAGWHGASRRISEGCDVEEVGLKVGGSVRSRASGLGSKRPSSRYLARIAIGAMQTLVNFLSFWRWP